MRRSKRSQAARHLMWDAVVLGISIAIAVLLVRSGAFASIVSISRSFEMIGAFVTGIFFTSMFTVAASTVAFAEIGTPQNMLAVSLIGAAGAVCGDMLLFLFIRDTLAEDVREVFKKTSYRKVMARFHGGVFRWLSPVLGAIVIASPLPDELGLALMGMSRVRSIILIPITFVMNFAGIYAIIAITNEL